MTRKEFCDKVLGKLNAPKSANNRRALVAWAHTEGYGGINNPFNTSLKLEGSTTYNSHGVQNYVSIEDGVTATVRTLKEGREEWGYRRIINRLRDDADPEQTLKALINSSWGTTDLVLRVLEDVRDDFQTYADAPAAKEA